VSQGVQGVNGLSWDPLCGMNQLTRRTWLATVFAPLGVACVKKRSMAGANAIFIGTSITAGNHLGNPTVERFSTLVGNALSQLTVSNIGVPSSTCDSANQLATANALVDPFKQNFAIIEFGPNDGLTKTAAEFEGDLATFVAGLDARFVPLPLTMLPCGSYDSVAFRAAINPNTLATYAHVIDVGNISTTMGAEAAKNDGALYSDTVHPTAFGNTLLAQSIITVLQGLMIAPTFSSKRYQLIRSASRSR